MKKLINILLALVIAFSGINSCAFAKMKTSEQSTKIEKPKKEKKTKQAKEKKTKPVKEKKVKQPKEKKVKEETPKKTKKTKIKDLDSLTQTEREKIYLERDYNPKRSKLAKALNPNLDVTEIRASHILVKKRKDAVSIRKDIKSGKITFEDAARAYSLCPTGINGGDLGYFNRKKMDQYFTERAFDLKIDEISEPVGTKFGWHLIKLVDRR